MIYAQAGDRTTLVAVAEDRRQISRTAGQPDPGASGAVNRSSRPDFARYMSVTTALQGLTAAHHETRRHTNKKARETGKTQLTGRFRR